MGKMSENKLALLLISLLLLVPMVVSDDEKYAGPTAADSQVFSLINEYRTTAANLSALVFNRGAGCVGHGIAFRFKDMPCTNETGADTSFGENPQIPDYLTLLKHCDVSLDNVKSSYLAPNCVPPGSGPSVAAQNITLDQTYQIALNDSTYVLGGVGSVGQWYVLALGTALPDGNFDSTPGAIDDGGQSNLQVSFFSSIGIISLSMFAAL